MGWVSYISYHVNQPSLACTWLGFDKIVKGNGCVCVVCGKTDYTAKLNPISTGGGGGLKVPRLCFRVNYSMLECF